MISSALMNLGKELRRAATRRAYGDVQRLTVTLGARAAEEVRALPPGDAGRAGIAAWLKEEYRRTEILLRISRAAQAKELRRVVFLQRYLPAPDPFARHVVGNY